MATYTLETVKRRIYIVGNTFPIKDQLSALGATFDYEGRRQWWVGTGKRALVEKLLAELDSQAPSQSAGEQGAKPAEPYTGAVQGKAKYKGRDYYVRYAGPTSRGGDAFHLVTADGKLSFWADASACEWTKRYEKRGRYGKVDNERGSYPTLAGIQRFIERDKRETKATGIDCWKCRREAEKGEAALREHLHDGCDVCGREN